jgi:hypothetical protein
MQYSGAKNNKEAAFIVVVNGPYPPPEDCHGKN